MRAPAAALCSLSKCCHFFLCYIVSLSASHTLRWLHRKARPPLRLSPGWWMPGVPPHNRLPWGTSQSPDKLVHEGDRRQHSAGPALFRVVKGKNKEEQTPVLGTSGGACGTAESLPHSDAPREPLWFMTVKHRRVLWRKPRKTEKRKMLQGLSLMDIRLVAGRSGAICSSWTIF